MAGLRLGVLGGTFDPVHLGHLILAECARQQLALDRVLFIPAGDPWRKAGRRISAAQDRLAMASLAAKDNPAFAVDDREIKRPGPSYTAQTLRELRSEIVGEGELYFLVGEDALADMSYWHDPAGIVAAARLAVAPRADSVPADRQLTDGARIDRIDMPYVSISSTDLRERVSRGQSIRYMVPDAVADYIAEHRLYRGSEA